MQASATLEEAPSRAASWVQPTVIAVLLAISFSHLLNDTIQALIPSIYPLLRESYHLTFAQLGWITFTFQCTASLFQPLVGWTLDRITDDVLPKLATVTISSEFLAVDPGYVCGIVQDGIGYRKGQPVIRLHLEAYLGAPDPYDTVDIEGSPRLSMKIPGGVPGDLATASIVVNSIPKVLAAAPGLHTMRDMPLPSFFPGR